ncbi:MAG: DedA family protein [Proteobacteria bacterium]|nr:DedA family protein [Desulfobacula sp.]MBU3953694.1 DedA family protein [Pseudomonadota bacterium]MBU4133279.1 DedA family protein [Pseudomonadota bacterium]
MEFLTGYGLWGLFAASFLAATILPLSSEVVLGYLLVHNFNAFQAVGVATVGNVLGALLNYGLGRAGSKVLLERIFRISAQEIDTARRRFKTHGTLSLLLAWVPIIGDPLTVVAGMLKINIWVFLALVSIGKFARYATLSWAVLFL